MLTDDVMKAGGREICSVVSYLGEEPDIVAAWAFEAMWRVIRTSQKKAK